MLPQSDEQISQLLPESPRKSMSPRKKGQRAKPMFTSPRHSDIRTDSGSLLNAIIVEEEGDEDSRSPVKPGDPSAETLSVDPVKLPSDRRRAFTEYMKAPDQSPHSRTSGYSFRKTMTTVSSSTAGSALAQLRQTPLQSPRPSCSTLSRFSVNTTVIRDATSRSTFWKHHTEMITHLAKHFPSDYTVEGIPIGFVPSLVIMGLNDEEDARQATVASAPEGSQDVSRHFSCDVLVRKSSRASSRCSSADSSLRNTHRSRASSSDDSDDDENPPFDLPVWLAREDTGGGSEQEDGSGFSSEGFSDVSDVDED